VGLVVGSVMSTGGLTALVTKILLAKKVKNKEQQS
jgi:hypothetical protein